MATTMLRTINGLRLLRKNILIISLQYSAFTNRYVGMSANPDSANTTFHKNAYLTLPYHKEDGTEANLEIRMHSQAESRYFVKNGGRNGNSNMPARAIESVDYEIDQDKIGCFTPILTYPETCLCWLKLLLKRLGSSRKRCNDMVSRRYTGFC